MRKSFDEQLEQLNLDLIEMGAKVENSIEMAVKALITHDKQLAEEVIVGDKEIDQMEKEIESICLKLILHQQPVAQDLRLISTALKIITDMERIGDQAADISEITLLVSDDNYLNQTDKFEKMAKTTREMVTESINAYVKRDLELAKSVIEKDDIVDDLFVDVKNNLTDLIHEKKDNGWQALDFLMIAKYFERIGDHAENIAEWVEFFITGEHKNKRII